MEFDEYQLVILRTASTARQLMKEEQEKLKAGHRGHFVKMRPSVFLSP